MKFKVRKLTKPQRHFFADKFMDTVNYAVAAMVFNEITGDIRFKFIFFGLIFFILGFIITYTLRK